MYENSPRIRMDPAPSVLEKTTDIYELWRIYKERALGQLSPRTTHTRWTSINQFVSKINKTDIKDVNRDDLEKFKALKLDKCQPSTVKKYLSDISSFLQYYGIDLIIPKIRVPKDREAKIAKQLITPQEFIRLLEVTDDPTYKAAFAILYEVAVRVGQDSHKEGYPRRGLLGLNWGDIDFKSAKVTVHIKRGKVKALPLGKLSERYLKDLKESGNKGKIGPDDPVFVSRRGNRLSYEQFRRKLKRYMEYAGIPEEKRHAHAFRHTAATRVTAKFGKDVAQLLLDHDKITTTEIYVHLAEEDHLMQKLRPDKIEGEVDNEVDVKVCPECDYELLPDRAICVCGYDFTLHRCPSCGGHIEEDVNFCPYCTAKIGVPKPECICGRELKPDYKICPSCGRPIDEVKKLWNENHLERWRRATQHAHKVNAGAEIGRETSRSAKVLEGDMNNEGIDILDHEREKTSTSQTATPEKPEKKGAFLLDRSDCGANNHAENCKPYETRIITKEDVEELIRLLDEGWDPLKELADGRFIIRRKRT